MGCPPPRPTYSVSIVLTFRNQGWEYCFSSGWPVLEDWQSSRRSRRISAGRFPELLLAKFAGSAGRNCWMLRLRRSHPRAEEFIQVNDAQPKGGDRSTGWERFGNEIRKIQPDLFETKRLCSNQEDGRCWPGQGSFFLTFCPALQHH